jgi:site-specific recombinase XerD
MATKIKFFVTSPKVKKESKKKKDEVNILVRFSNGRQFDLTAISGKQIKPDFWNNDTGKVRNVAAFKDSDKFQGKLHELRDSILDEFKETPDKTTINKDWLNTTIDKYYNPGKYLQDNKTLFGFIRNFIENMDKRTNIDTGKPLSLKTKQEYHTTFSYLQRYAEKFGEPDFIDIDLEFYDQFVDFLRNYEIKDKDGNIVKPGLAVNTIGKRIKTLKTFLNDATEKGINPYLKFKSKKFKKLTEDSDNIYLTKDELNQLYHYDFSNKPYLERVRDLFIVGCWTGLRFSDLKQLTPDRMESDFIKLNPYKTEKPVVIPVHFTVKEILNKYNAKLPEPISNQKFNDYLKEAAEIAKINSFFVKTVTLKGMRHEKKYPKHELISSHTARRSFCTNAYKDGIQTLSIMAISGHKTEKAFLKYIKVEPEEHAKKVLQMWQNNGDYISISK